MFSPAAVEQLRAAAADYSLLLTKGYAEKSSLKLVGDRFALTERQRLAVMRNSGSDQKLALRKQKQLSLADLTGQPLAIDGYNILITIEAAVSGGFVFKARDGCIRDIAGIHGTYRKVTETVPAIELIGTFLKDHAAEDCLWLFDSPVSNSGRLKTLIGGLAEKNNWNWEVRLSLNPDAELAKTDSAVASSDSTVLDKCQRWVNLAGVLIESRIPDAHLIDMV